MAKSFTIEAKVHKKVKQGYRVKISVLDIGMYINGAITQPPNEAHSDWWVFPPAQQIYGNYITILEFDKKKPFWQEIYIACIEATQQYISEADVAPLDIPGIPIDIRDIDIPFK